MSEQHKESAMDRTFRTGLATLVVAVLASGGLVSYQSIYRRIDVLRDERRNGIDAIMARLNDQPDQRVRAVRTVEVIAGPVRSIISVNMLASDTVESWVPWSTDFLARALASDPVKAK